MTDCNPERIMNLWNMWLKLDYIPFLNVLQITDSLHGIAQFLFLKWIRYKENVFAFWVKIISLN